MAWVWTVIVIFVAAIAVAATALVLLPLAAQSELVSEQDSDIPDDDPTWYADNFRV